ncbi:ABC transporter permease [Geodermatophilus ruber]|uniref:Monosaccharide ABC transporter membrane protein, CUT2 family n=1 Tax=Geodermatophilus ruber TaxID=504800 RepID=A0A1I4HPP5_9ACTN|nr:ABC transporter permease [Geodermatophilus ruber]SFL44122.1 monosaccharide ABC transporter membrane protein, CUT2 family [Geodermatophilus ruber]
MSATDTVETKDTRPAPPAAGGGSVRGRWGEKAALPVAWLVLFVVFAALAPGTFLSMGNISNILGSQSILFMLALAALLPSRSGDLDLSLGSIGGLAAILVAVLNVNHGVPIALACLIAVVVGALCGAFNGLVVVKFKTEPFIMTLGTGTLFGGLVFWIANSTTVVGVDRGLSMWTYLRQIGGIPVQFFYCLLVMLAIWYVMNYTPLGVRNLFVGQSREVAVLSGINADRIRFGAFVLAGVIAALAGVLYVGTTGSAGPTSVETFLLPAYAAVFLGATTIQPGRFNALGTGVAVLFLATGTAGLQLLGAQDFAQQLFYGGALVLAVAISRYLRRN